MKYYDVVVVGAGLAGLQLARLLGRQGQRVLLVDRKPGVETAVHTTGIFVRKTLEDFAFPEDCLGPPIRQVTLYSPQRQSLELRSHRDEFRIGRMRQLYARSLNHCLRNGVEWWPKTSYEGHESSQTQLVVRLRSRKASRPVRTRFLIGADGANSRVARNLGLDLNHEWIVGLEEVFANVPLTGEPRLHCFLDSRIAPGYLAWVAIDGEEAHVGVGGYPERFDPQTALKHFRESLDGIVDLEPAQLIERRGGRIPVGGVLRKIANPSGLLVGDAAGAVSPLTAGGLDPCLRLSTYAAQATIRYLNTDNPEELTAYCGDLFRPRFLARLWLRRVLRNLQQPQLLELAFQMLRLPLVNQVAWQIFFGRGSFPVMEKSFDPSNSIEASELLDELR